MTEYPSLTVGKLEAARRQLNTALNLWLDDGDPVSIHTLACAAYEIIHVVSKKRGRTLDLIFDSLVIPDQYRSEFNIGVKEPASFFKHANRDPESSLTFAPIANEIFIMFSIVGIELMQEPKTLEEGVFVYWLLLHRPEIMSTRAKDNFANKIPVEAIARLKKLSRRELFKAIQAVENKWWLKGS